MLVLLLLLLGGHWNFSVMEHDKLLSGRGVNSRSVGVGWGGGRYPAKKERDELH